MLLKCLVIVLNVLLSKYAATEATLSECNSKELRCADGQCRPIDEGCGGFMLKALLAPYTKPAINNEKISTPVLPTHQVNNSHTECRLRMQPQYSYECLNEKCNDFISQGTVVNVTRRASDSAKPVNVQVTCGLNGTYNVNFGCMGEVERLQKELHDLSINKMTAYATEFNKRSQNVYQTKKLVVNYNLFKSQVQSKLDEIQNKVEECDIYFDFLLNQSDDEFLASLEETNQACDLPPHPKNGWYNVTKSQVPNLVPNEMTDLLALDYNCERNFALIGTKSPRCINGVWLDEFPHCSAACKLEKKSGLNYHCHKVDSDDDACEDYVTVGSAVKVSRQAQENVTVTISCLNGSTFNISTDCVEEIDDYQREFEKPAMEKMIEFETKFNEMADNTVSSQFETLVHEFHSFEQQVIDNLNLMHKKAEECDLYLDLLLP